MKKLFQNSSFSILIYFLFYIFLSTSGIISVFYLFILASTVIRIQTASFSDSYLFLLEDLRSELLLALPALGVTLGSFILVRKIKNTWMFFGLTFFIIAISHFLLSRSTHIELRDIRLVLAAMLYMSLLGLTLTVAWKRIIMHKNYNLSFFLFIIILVSVAINLYTPEFMLDMYVSFAWSLNSIDFLFEKLNMSFIYFVIVLLNVSSCFVTLLYVTSFSKKRNLIDA